MKKSKLLEIKKGLVNFKCSNKEYQVKAKKLEVDESLLLILLFKVKKFKYCVFLWENDYITYEDTSGRWKTAGLDRLLPYQYKKLIFSKEALKEIKDYYASCSNLKESLYNTELKSIILEHQEQIRSNRLTKKHDKIREQIDKVMMLIKPLPKDINKWIDDVAHYKSRYIFFKGNKGYCSVCQKDIEILENHKHNMEGQCPNCKKNIVYKAIGYSKNILDCCVFTYLQKTDEGFFIRIFDTKKDYRKNIKNPNITYFEVRRYYCKGDNCKYYHYGNFFNVETRWCNGVSSSSGFNHNYFTDEGAVYSRNLKYVLKKSYFKHCGLVEYIKNRKNQYVDVEKYLHRYYHHPVLEKLVKSDLSNLTERILLTNRSIEDAEFKPGMRLHESLKIRKESYNMLRIVNGCENTLNLLQFIDKNSIKIELEQLQWLIKHKLSYHIIDVLKYSTVTKVINYLQKSEDERYKMRLDTWKDYINMCLKLKYDLNNSMTLYPRHLKKRHDEALLIWQDQNIELCDQYLKNRHEKTEIMYRFKKNKFLIMAPRNRIDIIREGEALSHCVRSKVENAALEKTTILFIRKTTKKDKPYYTLEVNNNHKIVQCYGYKNCEQTKEIEQLLSNYEEKVLSKLK